MRLLVELPNISQEKLSLVSCRIKKISRWLVIDYKSLLTFVPSLKILIMNIKLRRMVNGSSLQTLCLLI